MDVRFVPLALRAIEELRCEAIALPFFSDERPLRGAAGLCDWRLAGSLSREILRGRLRADAGVVTLLPIRRRLPFEKLVFLGMGTRRTLADDELRQFTDAILGAMEGLRLRTFALALPGRATESTQPAQALRALVDASNGRDFDEAMVLDEPEAQRVMAGLLETERRRVRASRALETPGEPEPARSEKPA